MKPSGSVRELSFFHGIIRDLACALTMQVIRAMRFAWDESGFGESGIEEGWPGHVFLSLFTCNSFHFLKVITIRLQT